MQNMTAEEQILHLGLTVSPEQLSPQHGQPRPVRALTSQGLPQHLNSTSANQCRFGASREATD